MALGAIPAAKLTNGDLLVLQVFLELTLAHRCLGQAAVYLLIVAIVATGHLDLRFVVALEAPAHGQWGPLLRLVHPGVHGAMTLLALDLGHGNVLGVIEIHVVGQVKRPGVVRLRPGARVADAIDAAGGVTAKADLSSVNLARPVLDGEQVVVSRPGEATRGPGSPGAPAGSASPATPPKVSLNTADGPALDTLPGVGPVLAQRILDWRAQNGRFASIDQLGEVSGIGENLLATLVPRVVKASSA